MRWANRLGPGLVLVAMLAIVYGPAIAHGVLLAVADGIGYYLPVRVLAAQSLLHGELPFWNPADYGGIPLHAMMQAGIFYPGNFAFLCLPPVAAMNATVLLGSFIGGLTMYAFGRSLNFDRAPAMTMAVPFMLAGYLGAHLEQLTSVQVVGLLPGVLWAIERYAQTLDVRYAWACTGLYTLQLLAGYPQTSLVTLVIVFFYALHRRPVVWHAFARELSIAFVLALALAAVQLLPAFDLLAQSDRLDQTVLQLSRHALLPRQLITLLFPYMFGGAGGPVFGMRYWGAGSYYIELTGYVGLATVLLACVAWTDFRRDRRVRFWTYFGGVGLLLAIGNLNPLYPLWIKLPLMRSIRVPGRHLLEIDLALIVLAGLGLQALQRADATERRWKVSWAIGITGGVMTLVLAVIGAAGPAIVRHFAPWNPWLTHVQPLSLALPAFWVPVGVWAATAGTLGAIAHRPTPGRHTLLLGVLLLDLWGFSLGQDWRVLGAAPASMPSTPYPPHQAYRTLAIAPGNPTNTYRGAEVVRYPMLGALWGERSAGGYEAFELKRYVKVMGHLSLSAPPFDTYGPLHHGLDILGVRTVRLDRGSDLPRWQATFLPPRWRHVSDDVNVRTYENTQALPRAWRPGKAVVLAPDTVDERVSHDATFEPRALSLLEDGPAPGPLTPGTATTEPLSFNRLAVQTTGTGAGLVLVNESFDRGWRAWNERGQELRVRRADGLVLGVEVGAGLQRFTLVYTPPAWPWAVAISTVAFGATLVWCAWGYRRLGALA